MLTRLRPTPQGNRLTTRDLTGKVVVVTGAGSGIGREVALLAAQRGAGLALCDVDAAGLAHTANLAIAATGRTPHTGIVDVADAAAVDEFADSTRTAFGGVDLLVNNAGVGLVGGFADTSEKDWDWIVGVNLMGVVHGCASFVPVMIERGRGGHVVNLSSAAGVLANPQLTAYSATKYAVFGFSEALRMELRPHRIGVTAVCPGIINTPITANSPIRGDADPGARREKLAQLYARRGYTPDRVARNILAAVEANKAVAPIAAEAHLMYLTSRFTPPAARWLAARLADLSK